MRTEREMTALILGVAERDARVRAVFMNGSRANPNAPRDIFQDYDIVYVVEETASFRAQPGWVDVFGERLVMQTPDEMDHAAGQPTDLARCYGYLMQFADGNRIDLRLMTLPRALEECQSDSQTIVLLDKDGILPPLPLPSDTAYHIRRPDQTAFAGCCNEFWWTLPYVAKGLWRGRVTYALDTLNACVRPQLLHMLSWLAGTRPSWQGNYYLALCKMQDGHRDEALELLNHPKGDPAKIDFYPFRPAGLAAKRLLPSRIGSARGFPDRARRSAHHMVAGRPLYGPQPMGRSTKIPDPAAVRG